MHSDQKYAFEKMENQKLYEKKNTPPPTWNLVFQLAAVGGAQVSFISSGWWGTKCSEIPPKKAVKRGGRNARIENEAITEGESETECAGNGPTVQLRGRVPVSH